MSNTACTHLSREELVFIPHEDGYTLICYDDGDGMGVLPGVKFCPFCGVEIFGDTQRAELATMTAQAKADSEELERLAQSSVPLGSYYLNQAGEEVRIAEEDIGR